MNANTKSQAYVIYAEWGEARRTPRDQRLAECFPAVNEPERSAWLTEFKLVETEIWKIAEEGAQKHHTREAFEKRMFGHFPWMDKEALDKAWFLVCYYAWHEGYDKDKAQT